MLPFRLLLQEEGDTREIRWHIDSLPQHSSSGLDRLVFNQDSTPDVITAVAASDCMLLVARASGTIIRYRCGCSGSASPCHSCDAMSPATLIFPLQHAAHCQGGQVRPQVPPADHGHKLQQHKVCSDRHERRALLVSPPPLLHHSLP
jgi:hypothetical protein